MESYQYTAYGLNFESNFPLPEFRPHQNGRADVSVKYGKVPKKLDSPSGNGLAWQAAPGKLLLTVKDVARYLVVENREVIVQPDESADENTVRVFLLGSVLGALLHARQMLVLHSSVIRTEKGAVLFMGRSGAGKSTTLGALLKRGYAMMADDKAGIIVDKDGIAKSIPGFPYARLTAETVNALQFPVHGLQISSGLGKYVVPVQHFCAEPLKVYAAYSLHTHNKFEVKFEPLEKLEAFQILNQSTYRRNFLNGNEQQSAHFQTLSVLSGQAKVCKVFRAKSAAMIEKLADLIEEDFLR